MGVALNKWLYLVWWHQIASLVFKIFTSTHQFPIPLSHGNLHASCYMWLVHHHPSPVARPHCQVSIFEHIFANVLKVSKQQLELTVSMNEVCTTTPIEVGEAEDHHTMERSRKTQVQVNEENTVRHNNHIVRTIQLLTSIKSLSMVVIIPWLLNLTSVPSIIPMQPEKWGFKLDKCHHSTSSSQYISLARALVTHEAMKITSSDKTVHVTFH